MSRDGLYAADAGTHGAANANDRAVLAIANGDHRTLLQIPPAASGYDGKTDDSITFYVSITGCLRL